MRAFLLLSAVVAASAQAQTVYSWDDKDGTHYTDDASLIPKGAKVRTEAAGGTSSSFGTGGQLAATETQPAPEPTPARLDERAWRDRFISATRRVATLEKSIETLKANMPTPTTCNVVTVPTLPNGQVNPAGMPVQQCVNSWAYARAQRELADKQLELENAKTDLEQLDRQASYAGVPREWRRGW